MESLITAFKTGVDPHLRRAAATAIGAIGGTQAGPVLGAGLNDEAGIVRLAIVHALKGNTDPSLVPALKAVANEDKCTLPLGYREHETFDKDEGQRLQQQIWLEAVERLGEIDTPEAVGALLERLNSTQSLNYELFTRTWYVRTFLGTDTDHVWNHLVTVLARSKDQQILPGLISKLGRESKLLEHAIANYEDPRKPALLTQALKEGTREARLSAAKLLQKMRHTDGLIEGLKHTADANELGELTRILCANALGEMKAPEGLPGLIEALQRDDSVAVHRSVTDAIMAIDAERAEIALKAAIGRKGVRELFAGSPPGQARLRDVLWSVRRHKVV
jgi:HEAT repeat protein